MLETCKARWIWAPVCPKCGWARCSYGSYDPSRTTIMGYKLAPGFSRIHMVTFRLNTRMFPYPYAKRKQALRKVVRVFFFKKSWYAFNLVTGRFANVLRRSTKRRSERFVPSAMIQKSAIRMCIPRLRVVSHFSSGIEERTKRELAWKSLHARKGDTRRRLFSRGVIFTRARASLALLSLRKNGGPLVV